MIKSWRHKGLKLFYDTGSTAKIQHKHSDKLHDILQALDFATTPQQMNFPGLDFHPLKGNLKKFYSSIGSSDDSSDSSSSEEEDPASRQKRSP